MAKQKQSTESIRKEYNRMVGTIGKQIKALEKADADTPALSRWRNYFQKVTTTNPNRRTITRLRNEARRVLESGQLSIESQERSIANAIQKLHEDGYDFIDRNNFNYFFQFVDDARARGLGSLYSSEQLIEAIKSAVDQGLSDDTIRKNIDKWAEKIPKDKSGKAIEVSNPKPLKVHKYGDKGKRV